MAHPAIGDFSLPSTGERTFTLSEIPTRYAVAYFYPKDNTPGCTNEGEQFRDLHREFIAAGCTVVGISRDSLRSHEKFKEKMTFPFDLLADEEETVCAQFGVMKMKNMYGKQVRGIERSTFILSRDGKILREWRGVKVAGHAREVLEAVKAL